MGYLDVVYNKLRDELGLCQRSRDCFKEFLLAKYRFIQLLERRIVMNCNMLNKLKCESKVMLQKGRGNGMGKKGCS